MNLTALVRTISSLTLVVCFGIATAQQPLNKTINAPVDVSNMTDAEVRKIDVESKKITLKHAEIKNLDMPGMTMVFKVQDPKQLGQLKVGDKIKFKAEKVNGDYVVTDIQMAK
jgi:Cu(I)/Ag(I) efflux system periplasmic protein CusF